MPGTMIDGVWFPPDTHSERSLQQRFYDSPLPPLMQVTNGKLTLLDSGIELAQNRLRTYAELFAGVGGWGHGASSLGLLPILAIEKDPDIAAWYRKHHPLNSNVLALDISNVLVRALPKVDILLASPPCQPFSKGRVVRGSHPASQLANQIMQFVLQMQPKLVLIENVAQFAEYSPFHKLLYDLNEAGYITESHVLDACNYGIPQVRSRVFIIATKAPRKPQLPAQEKLVTWFTALSPFFDQFPQTELAEWQLERLPPLPPTTSMYDHIFQTACSKMVQYDARRMPASEGAVYGEPIAVIGGHSTRNLTLRLSHAPIFTVTASIGKQPTRIIFPNDMILQVTTEGTAALQTFPSGLKWPKHGNKAGKMIGNAVPPMLAAKLIAANM